MIGNNFNFGSVDGHNPITLLSTFMYKFYDGRNENIIFKETWVDTTNNLINNTHIKIKSPTLADPGNFHDTSQITNITNLKFDISLNGFDYLLLNTRNNLNEINSPIAKFEYKANMIIENIYPIWIPKEGGTKIKITGYNLASTNIGIVTIKINNSVLVTPDIINHTMILFTSPAMTLAAIDAPEAVPIELSNNGQDYTSFNLPLYFYTQPTLCYLVPRMNSNFYPTIDILCLWTALDVPFTNAWPGWNGKSDIYQFTADRGQYIRSDLILCPSPPVSRIDISDISTGGVNFPWYVNTTFRLQISLNNGYDYTAFIGNSLNYTIIPNPTVTGIVVENGALIGGPMRGGTLVCVIGSNFDQLEMKFLFVKFGDSRFVQVSSVVNSTMIQCYAPKSLYQRNVFVYVKYRDEMIYFYNDDYSTSSTIANLKFSYYNDIIIEDIIPPFGMKSGNTEIIFKRQHIHFITPTFVTKYKVKFTMPAIQDNFTVSTSITDIVIECTNNLQDYTNFDRYFRYINDATLIELYPPYGSELDNSRVIIHGSNFISSSLLRVRFENVAETHPIWVDSSILIVYTCFVE